MVRFSILPAAAVTLLLCGVQAGPCRPLTTGVTNIAESSSTVAPDTTATSLDTTAVTTLIEATSTVQEESTATTETSIAESVSTIASDTTIGSVDVTTTTALADPTTTAEVEATTTTAVPACVVTQLFTNPGFDNSDNDIAPWTNDKGAITQTSPQSGPNALSFNRLENSFDSFGVSQTLSNLYGTYEFSYHYRMVSVSQSADYTCDIELKVGDASLRGDFDYDVGGWKSGSVTFNDLKFAQADVQVIASCGGEYHQIVVNLDSLAFTRVCSE
ncbi:hypothetical protein NXS19_008363 [Fusarium pseudograminearum]|uniref:CBM-cenC domain-containing protein n=1 Tax=Fusarium pseudograminearum (strain CS3096) TaxID=1028729 RepID=K3W1G0_FUSPC|nr:hypothetical protein FPSE_04015 [Fusarium pseudograminearum CS3096]EKJ75835.1 hypothetical protein FPSE_04015 [Fusarium pseudograminearum CS3096]KAF0642282.1 hypothetical protein FPSE5266_04015 [Fusarium pseudograminearum]UZP40547.1 hypothetical protein NXS19_008363 [Fusarium pseudograminearum]